MYSIPPNPDLEGILGSPLIQVCFGEHDIQFRFDSESWIGSQATVEHLGKEGLLTSWGGNGLSGLAFQSLLGKAPTHFTIPSPRRLELHFNNDQVLALLDDSDKFESFQVYHHGDTVPSFVV